MLSVITPFVKTIVKSILALSVLCAIAFAQQDNESVFGTYRAREIAQPEQAQQYTPRTASYLRVNGHNEAYVSFGMSGGMRTLTVSTDGGGYDITSLPEWCSADKYGESFSLTCTENQTASERSELFTVVSGDKTVKITISQSGSGSGFSGRSSSAKSGSGFFGESSSTSSDRERRIDVSASYSYGIGLGGGRGFDSIAPAELTLKHFSNLSLSMGLNLYKNISAYFDLGIKDQGVKNAIEWAGRIGSKYFELQIDYYFVTGEVSYWNDANIGANKNRPPDLKMDYDQTWMTVVLMYPIHLSFDGWPILVGIFYNHAVVPALIWVNKESEDKETRFAFLDESCPVTTFGVRLNWAMNKSALDRKDNLSRGWTVKVPFWLTCDAGLGFADPNKDVTAMAAEKGGHFSDYSFPTFYIGGRMTLLVAFFNRFTENNIVHFGLGMGINMAGYRDNTFFNLKNFYNSKNLNNWSSIGAGGYTPIVRVGYVW